MKLVSLDCIIIWKIDIPTLRLVHDIFQSFFTISRISFQKYLTLNRWSNFQVSYHFGNLRVSAFFQRGWVKPPKLPLSDVPGWCQDLSTTRWLNFFIYNIFRRLSVRIKISQQPYSDGFIVVSKYRNMTDLSPTITSSIMTRHSS